MKFKNPTPKNLKEKRPARKLPSREQVSYTMSRVRSFGSVIELRLDSALWAAGLRYRKRHGIFGKPDFVLVRDRIAIFADSEFWHGYRWGEQRKAAHRTNQSYWFEKIERNRARDRIVNRKLRAEGWLVIRFWEREIIRDARSCADKVTKLAEMRRRS